MVYDAVHNVIADALGDLDPSFALEDFTAKDVTSTGVESVISRVMGALNTPAFLVDRRVVVCATRSLLLSDEVGLLLDWMNEPTLATTLVLAVVGTKANKLVKADPVVEVNVGSRTAERVSFVTEKMAEYGVSVDRNICRPSPTRWATTSRASTPWRAPCSRSTARRRSTSVTSSPISATPVTCPSGT
jgi:hypothetical protein